MTDSDGPLARVSYLPGAGRPSERDAPKYHHPESLTESPGTESPGTESRDTDGWYVEPSTAPVRRLPTFVPTDTDTDDGAVARGSAAPEAAPVSPRESPAMKKMRALVESAAGNADQQHPSVRSRRPYGQKSYAEDPPEQGDTPPSVAERAARAERVSMSALTRKGMSSWEMGERLRSQDLDAETINNEIARLEGVGLLNDFELAETLVRTLQDRKGLGRSGITAELRRRHVDQSAIDEALNALDSDDEVARALEIALKRAPQLRSLDSTTAHRRLSAFLMRKGYSGSAISAAVAGALDPGRGPRFR